MIDRLSPQEQRSGADLRLVPIAAAAWGGGWLGTAGGSMMIMMGLALGLVILGVAIFRRSSLALATVVMLIGALGLGVLHVSALATSATGRLARSGAVVTARLVTKEDPRITQADGIRPEFLTQHATLTQVQGRGERWRERTPVLVTAGGDAVPGWRDLIAGSSVTATVRLQAPEPGDSIAAVARAVGPPRELGMPGVVWRSVERVRSGLRAAVARGSPEQRALVPSLVLGDTAKITDRIRADFQTTGLTHLTAVSGANLAILLAFLMVLARWIGVRGWWLRAVGLAAVVIFVLLCRTDPSVLRAAAMGLVALAALGMSDRSGGLRSLGVATIALIMIDPWLGRSLGFALSVLATGGIVWWGRRWVAAMQRWLPRVIGEAVAIPLAAHLATLPVVAAISEQVSMVGILTNAVAGPFVGPATVLGFAAAGVSVLSGAVAGVIGVLACWAAQPILWTGHYGSALPGASWAWPPTPVALLLLGAGCLVVAAAMPWVLRSRWLALAVAVLMIIAVVRAPVQPGWPPKDWLLVACDVGQGDGFAIRAGDRAAVVVDTGPDPALMRRCLDQLGVRRVPLLILTHYHADHVGGLDGVLAGRRVEQLWVSPFASPPQEAAAVAWTGAQLGIATTIPQVGQDSAVGSARIAVLGPVGHIPTPRVSSAAGESPGENDMSLVLKITVGGMRILMTGDAEPAEQKLITGSGADLSADVLKVPHHGSSRQDADFVAATGARVAIASAGKDNDYGHPAPRTMRLLRGDGMTALCTCERGSIAVAGEPAPGRGLRVITQRTP